MKPEDMTQKEEIAIEMLKEAIERSENYYGEVSDEFKKELQEIANEL